MSTIETVSDAFTCLPSASDSAMLDDAFTAIGDVYHAAWDACDKLYPPVDMPVYANRLGCAALDEFIDLHNAIDAAELFHKVVTRERRRLSRGLGSDVDSVFMFYVQKAIGDHGHRISLGCRDHFRQSVLCKVIGLPLPIENVTIESTDDGLDWLRFDEIGPVEFGFIGSIPSRAHTVCFKRTNDLEGYEVVFVADDRFGFKHASRK